jgi:hypothetical protein
MSYIGREPQIGNFQVCDAISVVNGQAAYTMQVGGANVSPETANHMIVSLNGIIQAPGTSYTVSGSTITFASNLATGDVINFIHILGSVLDLGVPSDDTVGAAQIKDDLISGTTALASEPADTDEFLVSDAGTLKRLDYSLIKASSTPAFLATRNSNQSISANTTTKIQFDDESFDTDNTYDNSTNYRFTPAVAGKYVIGASVGVDTQSDHNHLSVEIQKNGTAIAYAIDGNQHLGVRNMTIIDDADDDDYYEVYLRQDNGTENTTASAAICYFWGYKLA